MFNNPTLKDGGSAWKPGSPLEPPASEISVAENDILHQSPFPSQKLQNDTHTYSDEKPHHGAYARGHETLAEMDAANIDTAQVHAGRLPEEMYTNALHPWRAAIRRLMVEIVKVETPVLAKLQVRVVLFLYIFRLPFVE